MEEQKRPETGCCKFCGQTRIIEMTEGEWLHEIAELGLPEDQIADILTMEQCNCKEGVEWRNDRRVVKQTRENIEILFREKYPEIADMLQEAVMLVWTGQIKRITVQNWKSGTASMYRKDAKLEIKYTQKKESTMTAS